MNSDREPIGNFSGNKAAGRKTRENVNIPQKCVFVVLHDE